MKEPETAIVRQLLLLGTFLQRQAGRELAGLGLNQQQFVVLREIQEKEPVNQKQLCSALLLEKANVSKIVTKLARMGLVSRRAHERDGRLWQVTLTAAGADVVRRGMGRLNRWNRSWLSSLPGNERDRILASLDTLAARAGKAR